MAKWKKAVGLDLQVCTEPTSPSRPLTLDVGGCKAQEDGDGKKEKVLDNDLEDSTQASFSSPRRISTSDAPLGAHSPSSSPRGSLSLCGRSSRRVSLIPGEALEQAQAAFLLAQAQGRLPQQQQHSTVPEHLHQHDAHLASPQLQQKQHHHHYQPIAQRDIDLHEGSSSGTPQKGRPSFHCDPGGTTRPGTPSSGEADDAREAANEPRAEDGASAAAESEKKTTGVEPLSPQSAPSNPGMKSNQRWLKLRTTVQLSGALSSSMNRNKPPLKREDSFIKRFSTRQIAELQDTVDQTDEEDVSRNSTGSPKLRKKRRKRQPRTVINPYGNVYFYWLCVLTICVLYNLWTSIVREAFPELNVRPQPLWYLLDAISDLIILLDIVVQFRTGYLEQGLIVYDSRKLANHYMISKCFMLDLAALLPLEFLQFAVGAHPMLRFPRFVKIYRVYNYYYMVESRTLWPNFWRVLNLVHILLLLAHWFGCFYYMLSEAEHFRGEWTYPYDHGPDFATLSRKYLGSVYWSTLTLTTIGDLPTPETNKENRTSFPSNRTDRNMSQLGQLHWGGGGVAFGTIGPYRMPQPTSLVPAVQSQHPRPAAEVAATGATAGEATGGTTPSRPATPHLQITHVLPNAKSSSRALATLEEEEDSEGVAHGDATGSTTPEKAEAEEESHGLSEATGETTDLARAEGPVALPRRGLRSRLIKIKTNAGYVFTIISYLIGVFIFATIVGQVGNVITNRNANRLEFERLLDGAKLYMRHHKVPREMQRRVQRWYDYSWSRGRIQGGGDINTALGLLPDKLKTELALHVNLTTLKKVSIFKECQPEFLHDLVLKMKAYIFTPGDLICRKGEVAREMFIIADGILEVISETGKVLTTMKAGDFFGEIGILNLDGLNKRTADVRSVGYSELFSLSREDVLAAMKDYPEAQEILQSLGRKRLMDARHSTPKSSISGASSKRGTPSPCREFNPDDNQAKKIVHRLRSDVSALRNAFRRSKGTLREMETYELEPLTADGRGGSSENEDLPGVKRILRRMRKDGASGSSETSVSGTRGVLRRMARVTSDDAHINTLILNRNSSPTHKVASPVSEDQGVLGAGLPLLQRLKLLKEKEEREERLRQQELENEARSQHPGSNDKPKENGEQEPPAEEEPEVIGAGLPLFARLRLLKAKEEKERLEREEKQKKKLSSDNSQGSVTRNDTKPEPATAVVREGVQGKESKASEPSSNRAGKSNSTERTSSQESRSRDSDTGSGASDSRGKGPPSVVAATANSVQPGQALDRAFGKLLSKKMKVSAAAAGPSAAAAAARTSTKASEGGNDKALSETKNTDSDSDNKSKDKSSACQKPLQTLQVKDKVIRSESFKKAIDEGLIRSTEIKSPTKDTSKDLKEADKESKEQRGKSSPVDRPPVGSSLTSTSTVSAPSSNSPASQEATRDSGKAEDKVSEVSKKEEKKKEEEKKEEEKKKEEEGSGRTGTFKGEAIPTIALSSTPPPERKELESGRKKTVQKVDSLKVPDEDVSPPLSSPESNETPERKSLKSILKRMSREDSGSNLLPPKGADLKKLMKAPTVEGFVARRSKFSKSVSFQRQTLSSPPLPGNLTADTASRNSRGGGASKGKDGIDKVLTKLGALGLDASPSPPNDTQGLVRKIIHGKLATSSLEDEVELLWAARVEELQQQLARRDETIRQLTHTLLIIQSESQSNTKEKDQDLEDDVDTDESSRERVSHEGDTSSSEGVPSDGETVEGDEDEDEDEPLFMRCDSIESIIHHTPRMSPDEEDDDLAQLDDEYPSTNYEGSIEVSDEEQERPRLPRMSRSLDAGTAEELWRLEFPNNWTRTSSLTSRPVGEVALDIGSSTDEDIHSLSSDDDHAVPGIPSDYVNEEEFVTSEVLGDVEEGACPTQTLNSQDWEVQMLAEELAKKQRGVAKQVDRDIEAGRVHSGLVDLHEALISSNLNDLSDNDVLRLEKVIHTERERLRHYARMYSLDEQPVLEQEFTALYRSRSQLLVSRSSELFKAGPKQRKLSKLLNQLATLSPAEKFLLDRILYTTARKQQLVRHKSMCDDQLTTHSDHRLLEAKRRTLMSKRSISMCTPSVDNSPVLPRASLATSGTSQEDPKSKREGKSKSLLERRGPPTVSAMLASLQRSVSVMSGNGSRESVAKAPSPQRNAPRKQEAEPLLRPPQEQ